VINGVDISSDGFVPSGTVIDGPRKFVVNVDRALSGGYRAAQLL